MNQKQAANPSQDPSRVSCEDLLATLVLHFEVFLKEESAFVAEDACSWVSNKIPAHRHS